MKLSLHMAKEHISVTDNSVNYFKSQGRYNYVTPKSYLELIGFYKGLLGDKELKYGDTNVSMLVCQLFEKLLMMWRS